MEKLLQRKSLQKFFILSSIEMLSVQDEYFFMHSSNFSNQLPITWKAFLPIVFLPSFSTKLFYQGFLPSFSTQLFYQDFLPSFSTKLFYHAFLPSVSTKRPISPERCSAKDILLHNFTDLMDSDSQGFNKYSIFIINISLFECVEFSWQDTINTLYLVYSNLCENKIMLK